MMVGDINSKDDLVGYLISLRMAAIYDIFAQTCLHEFIKKWNQGDVNPDELTTVLPEGTITFRQFMKQLAVFGNDVPVETKRNANRFLTRNTLKEVFRITQSYYQETGQANTMTVEDWYEFSRIVLNSLSHNFRLDFCPHDLNQLPVSYKGETIDASMDRQPFSMQLSVLLSLIDDIINFAKNY